MYNKVKKSSDKSDILDFGSIYNQIRTRLIRGAVCN